MSQSDMIMRHDEHAPSSSSEIMNHIALGLKYANSTLMLLFSSPHFLSNDPPSPVKPSYRCSKRKSRAHSEATVAA